MNGADEPTSPGREPLGAEPSDEIPGAPDWAQEFYRRVHADVRLVLVQFHALRAQVEAVRADVELERARLDELERWRHGFESGRRTMPPAPEGT